MTLSPLEAFGVVRGWAPDEQTEVRNHNSGLWRALKKRNGWNVGAVADIPGFADSLQRLNDQGYCPTDISAFFGVSRARCHQWFNECGIKRDNTKGSLVRVWSDELNQFTAVHPSVFRRMVADRGAAQVWKRRLVRIHDTALKAYADVELLRELAVRLGRSPYRVEFLQEMGFAGEEEMKGYLNVSRRWGFDTYRSAKCSYREAWAAFYRCAGLQGTLGTGRTRKAGAVHEKHSDSVVARARALREEGLLYREIALRLGLKSQNVARQLVLLRKPTP